MLVFEQIPRFVAGHYGLATHFRAFIEYLAQIF